MSRNINRFLELVLVAGLVPVCLSHTGCSLIERPVPTRPYESDEVVLETESGQTTLRDPEILARFHRLLGSAEWDRVSSYPGRGHGIQFSRNGIPWLRSLFYDGDGFLWDVEPYDWDGSLKTALQNDDRVWLESLFQRDQNDPRHNNQLDPKSEIPPQCPVTSTET